MNKFFLSALCCFFAGLVLAQPVITMDNLLKVGDIVITQPCASPTFQPGGAGADQHWDFSQLAAEGGPDTTFYISPVGTPYVANYPSSNIVARFGADSYGYYQTSPDQLFFWGQTDPSSALVLSDPAVYFQSPTTYGTFVLDSIAGSLTAPPPTGAVTGHVYFSGDGYGSLQTPGGTFEDVLRVRTVTVGIATVPFFGSITDSVFNYSWYKPGIQSPVLEMIEDTQWAAGSVISQLRYVNYFNSITSKTGEADAPSTIRVYPNPATDEIRFSGLENAGRVVLRNAAGQTVLTETITGSSAVRLPALTPGVYFCTFSGDDMKPQVLKIMVQ